MSGQNSYSYSSSSFSSSSYNSSNGGPPQTHSYSEQITSDGSGSTIQRTSQEPGQAPVHETLNVGPNGKYIGGSNGSGQPRLEQGRVEEVTDADRDYEERMEDEYAKREGGA